MASERQIAANRRNARKSTGPRSRAGKNRSSRNAYSHGLTVSITSIAAMAKQLDKLARKIAGDTKNPILLEGSHAVAQAQFDLGRARQAKVALIERACAFEASATMPSQEPYRSAEAIRPVLPELRKLERYERRAAARRDRAIVALELNKLQNHLGRCRW